VQALVSDPVVVGFPWLHLPLTYIGRRCNDVSDKRNGVYFSFIRGGGLS
jgi:hypothetical protein